MRHETTRLERGCVILILCLAIAASACAGGGVAPCRVGSDCGSGVCFADGTCAPLDAGSARDAGAPGEDDADIDEDTGVAGCGDHDGRIGAAELPLPLGETVRLRAAFDTAVDTHGVERADGTRLWDLEGPFDGDVERSFRRDAVAGTWFDASFPGATYTMPLGAEGDLLGVFERTASSVLLRGVVSPAGGITRTELTYDPPAPVWHFPLEEGASWDETCIVSGVTGGAATYYSERWQVSVDARGDLGTPAGVREVVRVSTLLTRTVGLAVTQHRRLVFVEECRGTVGQISGVDGMSAAEPAYAAELFRTAP